MHRICFLTGILCSAISSAQSTNYVASAGYVFPEITPVSVGQVVTLFVHGLNVPDAVANLPLPTTLSGVTVAVTYAPAAVYPAAFPIFSVRSPNVCGGGPEAFCNTTAVTVQIPYEGACVPNQFPNSCTIGPPPLVKVAVVVDGVSGQEFGFVLAGAPHLLNSCDSVIRPSGPCFAFVTHADGSLVSVNAPAHPGDAVAIYAVGLGGTKGAAKTGQMVALSDPIQGDLYLTPAFRISSQRTSTFVTSDQLIKADWAGLVKGFVGLYQINVRLPDTLPEGTQRCPGENLNVRIFLGASVAPENIKTTESVDICVSR